MNDKIYVTISEVSEYLKVSSSTLRKWINKGHVPSDCYIHIEDTYRFDLQALEKALLDVKDTEEVPTLD